MRISDWSSDVCSSDLPKKGRGSPRPFLSRFRDTARGYRSFRRPRRGLRRAAPAIPWADQTEKAAQVSRRRTPRGRDRSDEHTSELQSLMRNSYAVFCLQKNSTSQHYLSVETNK